MALSLMPLIKPQFFDDNGLPLSGGSVACFDPGTSDYKTIYTSQDGSVEQSNPCPLDSAGRAEIWLDGYYDIAVYSSSDGSGDPLYTVLNVAYSPEAGTSEYSGTLTMDDILEGDEYGRVLRTSISAGKILLSECSGSLDDIAEGETYGLIAKTYITAGQITIEGVNGLGLMALKDSVTLSDISDLGDLDIGDISEELGALAALDEVGMRNFVYNCFTSMWSSGTSSAPDGFVTNGSVTISRESTIRPNGISYTAKLVANGSDGGLYWNTTLNDLTPAGSLFSMSAWVYATAAAKVRIRLYDTDGVNITEKLSSDHPGDSAWHLLTIDNFESQADATNVYAGLEVDDGATGYITCVTKVIGPRAPRYILPAAFYGSSGASGFQVTSNSLGFYKNSGFRTYLDSSGNFICRTAAGSTAFRYYGTDSGIYNEGDVFIGSSTVGQGSIYWDQDNKRFDLDGTLRLISGGDLSILSGGSLTVSSGGGISVSSGGDITLTGHDSNPAKLLWDGSSYDVEFFANTAGNAVTLRQTTNTHGSSLYLGDTSYRFNNIDIVSDNSTDIWAYDSSSRFSRLTVDQSGIDLYYYNTAITPTRGFVSLYYSSAWTFGPDSGGYLNLGTDEVDFHYVYCTAVDTTDDINFFDDQDDLADIMAIRPLVDENGSYVTDQYGNPIIDDTSLPRYMLTLSSEDAPASTIETQDGRLITYPNRKKGEPVITADGKFRSTSNQWYGWLLGGIRQLNAKVDTQYDDIIKRLERIENNTVNL